MTIHISKSNLPRLDLSKLKRREHGENRRQWWMRMWLYGLIVLGLALLHFIDYACLTGVFSGDVSSRIAGWGFGIFFWGFTVYIDGYLVLRHRDLVEKARKQKEQDELAARRRAEEEARYRSNKKSYGYGGKY